MDPLTGVLIGGGLTLAGTVLSQWWTSKRDADRHERERAERDERDLKLAYVEWLAANQHAIMHMTSIVAMPKEKQDGLTIADVFRGDMAAAASKVRVLETDVNARERVADAAQIVAAFGAKVATAAGKDFKAILAEVADASGRLGEVERWVLANRFPPKTGEPPRSLASDARTQGAQVVPSSPMPISEK